MERLQPFLLHNLSLLEVTYTVPCMLKFKPWTRFGGFKVPRMSLASVVPFGRHDWRRSALSQIEARSRQVKLARTYKSEFSSFFLVRNSCGRC